MIYVALFVGCVLLYKGGDWLLDGMTSIGNKMGWPKAVTGLLLVSVGTSAPELFVSAGSAIQGHGAMAVGNVIGSNIINTAIVLGIAASVMVLFVEKVLRQQLVAMMLISIVLIILLADAQLTRSEGLILLLMMVISFLWAFKPQTQNTTGASLDTYTDIEKQRHPALLTVVGIVTLLVGAESLIWGGLALADRLMISETVVALTVTALGTSLPEVAATIVAVIRRETSLAVGNVIGSNLLNVGLVLGASALIAPLQNVAVSGLTSWVFLGLAFFMFVLGIKPAYYPRIAGVTLILSYFAYVTALVMI
jgi:cation:H+ antiporter